MNKNNSRSSRGSQNSAFLPQSTIGSTKGRSLLPTCKLVLVYQALLLFITHISPAHAISWSIKSLSVTSPKVSDTTSFNFQLSSTQAVTSGDCIRFTIQSPYVSPDQTYTAFSTNPTCSFSTTHSGTCTKLSTLQFQLTFTASSTSGTIIGSATNFINPYSQRNLNTIDISYYGGCSTASKLVTGTSALQNFQPGTISTTGMTIDSTPKTVGQTDATLQVTFIPNTVMKITGQIDFVLPVWYYITGTASTDTMLDSNSVVSSSQLTISSYYMNTDPNVRTMSVYYTTVTGSDITATSVTLAITNFKNPISTALVSGFQINTKDSKGNLIDQSSATLPMSNQMTTVAIMDAPTFSFRSTASSSYSTTFSVAQQTILQLNVQMPVPASDNCWMKVTFPTDILIDSSLNTFYGTGFLEDPLLTATISSSYITTSTSGNYVIIKGCLTTTQIGSNPAGSVGFQYINMPAQVKSTGMFSVQVYADAALSVGICQSTSFYIDSSQLLPGTVSLSTFQPVTTWVVQTLTSYTITFTPQHKLYYNSRIIITVPTLVTLGATCTISSSSGLGTTPACSVAGSTYIISTPFTNGGVTGVADYTGGTAITIIIATGTNAISARDAGSWTVTTQNCILTGTDCAYYNVDVGTATSSFLSVAGVLVPNTGVTSNNYVTYAGSATYTFAFNVLHTVPVGGVISIDMPSEVSIASTSLASSSAMYVNSGSHLTATATSSQIKMTMSSAHTSANNPLKLSFNGIRNPRTFQTSSTFTVSSQDSSGYIIDKGTGFTITMTTMGSMDTVAATMTNKTNGAYTTYTISFATLIPIYNNDIFYITFPSEIALPESTYLDCSVAKNINQVTCSSTGQSLQTKLKSLATGTGNFAFTVNNRVVNAPSTYPSSTFSSIYIKDSNGYSIAQYTGTVSVSTTTPANLLTYALTQNSLDSLASTSYRLTFTPTNKIATTGSILLIWPAQVTVSATSGCTVTTSSQYTQNCAINTVARSITITKVFESSSTYYTGVVAIELTNVINPQDNRATNGFQIFTYADALQIYKVDILADSILVPKLQCNYPCQTCSSSDKNYCSSCWTSGTFPYLQYVSSSSQICAQKCSNGYTTNGNSNKQCTACDTSCATCVDSFTSGDKYKCVTCAANYQYKYPPAQQCMASCGLGYYQQSPLVCDKCSSPCQGCYGGATNCTSCYLGSSAPYLFSNMCIASCPSGYTAVGYECLKCTSPCSTCVNSTTQCTSCDGTGGQKYTFGYSCYSSCPNGATANENTLKCEGCNTGCKTCDSNNQTYCLQCQSPLLNFNGQCISSCPTGYKVSLGGTSCQDSSLVDISLVYFPHLIAAAISVCICLVAYIRDRHSLIVSNILVFWGPIEFSAIFVQTGFSIIYGTYKYAGMALVALIFYVVANIAFFAFFMIRIRTKDHDFSLWRQWHKITFRVISLISLVLSYKVNRLLYSFFFGNHCFKATFSEPARVQKLIIFFTVFHLILTSAPIVIVDVVGLIYLSWGTQLYICMIETIVLTIAGLVLTFVEFCRLRKLLEDSNAANYKQVNSESQMITPSEEMEGKNSRKNALKALMALVKGNRDMFLNNKLDELLEEFGGRKCKSMIALDSEKEEDPRKIKSYPLSPRSKKEYEMNPFPFEKRELPDNVYAEGKEANPLAKVGKTYADADTQLDQSDLKDAISKKNVDLVNLDSDDGMQSGRRNKKNRRRGRKNKYYTQIDEEDDEEADALEGDAFDEDDDLDVINEEDEEVMQRNKEKKNKKMMQQQQELEQERLREEELLRQKQLEEQQRLQKEKEEEEQRQKLLKQQAEEEEEIHRQQQLLQQQQEAEKELQRQREIERAAAIAEQEKLMKEENERKEKELILQQEKLEQEQLEKEQRLKKEKDEEEKRQREEQEQQQEKERQRQLEIEREVEEEKLKKEQEEAMRKAREEMDASRLEDEIMQNKNTSANAANNEQIDDKLLQPESQTEHIMSKQLIEEAKHNSIPQVDRPVSVQAYSDGISNNGNGNPANDVIMMEESLQDFKAAGANRAQDELLQSVVPDASQRNFNENDILGDLDRDDKGNVIVLQDENGNYADKQGRKVNERGYLLDKSGNGDIINNNDMKQKMFDSKDMDERGEIPAPFCVEKYNFNPHNIRGDFDYDKLGKPIIAKNKRGELVDKKGRKVNKKGFLMDKGTQGNIIDRDGKKKFDKKQLTAEGDLPKMFNYSGRRYDINDIIGQFEKDSNNDLIFNKNSKGEIVDKLGRRVNEKGYLIDQEGNIIDKDGKKIFAKKHIKNGEVPKIFPFTKFNIKNVLGNFEMDPLGNPILDRNSDGNLIDRDGRRVNARGYLIDQNGNVIDKNGKVMFDKDILDEEGEIPKVFRTGLLKSDTASSLSRLMSEIERNQPSEFDDELMVQNEIRRLGAQTQQQTSQRRTDRQSQRKESGGNTSVDSMMEDTPSNYNIANQRFEPLKAKKVKKIREEEDESNFGDDNGGMGMLAKKRRKKKKKLVAEVFVEPSDKDLKMAKAYGGQPKAGVVKKMVVPKQSNSRMITTPASINMRDQTKERLHRLTNSISGYQNNDITSNNNNSSRNRRVSGGLGTDHFRPPGTLTQTNFLDQSNGDASIVAVPEHHMREEKLKQRKMNEMRQRKKQGQNQKMKKQNGAGGDPDFEKMFGKDIDEFLEDSDWDIESIGKTSQYSRGSSKSAFGQGRLRGLESIYLQRLETSMKKGGPGGAGSRQKQSKPKAKFRIMHDRFIDDPELMLDSNIPLNERHSGLSTSNKNFGMRSYMEGGGALSGTHQQMNKERSDINIFSGNKKMYDAAGKSTANFDKNYIP